jgi:hypothetical protein
VSASEKLKVLEALFEDESQNAAYTAEQEVLAALPQIVAVIEAAEKVATTTRTEYGPYVPTWAMRFGGVEDALAALEEVLT